MNEELATRGPRGPPHGLPITVKDAYEAEGMRTTSGAKPWKDHVPPLRADMQSFNIFGTTNNPHDVTRTPGGSSGGDAVSVACGFTAFELGSDIGGSIRTPASWTGVYGHKPSFGIVPQRGHMPPAPGSRLEPDLSVCGPMARGAGDLALLLDVLAGPDELQAKGDRLQLPGPRTSRLRDYRAAVWLDDPAFPGNL